MALPRNEYGLALGADLSTVTVDSYATAALSSADAALWYGGAHAALRADATLSRFETGHVLTYGAAHADLDLADGEWHTTAHADGGYGAFRGAMSSGYGELSVLAAHTTDAAVRIWGSAAAGRAGMATSYATAHVAAGMELACAPVTLAASVTGAHANTSYADATARLTLRALDGMIPRASALVLVADGGLRRGGDHQHPAWARATALVGFGTRTSIAASYGVFPADLEHATLGARAATVGLRVRFGHQPPAARMVSPVSSSQRVRVTPAASGTRAIVIALPDAHSVELMGDFTAWQPVAMTRSRDGAWYAALTITPGAHRANIRVDHGSWTTLPDLPQVSDDFGGGSSILVVP